MLNKIPLSSSDVDLDLKIDLSSLSKEPITDFEVVLENYFQDDNKVVALNSGTSAIHLALILSGVKKDDIVLCQSLTFIASINPVLYQQAIPIFIDSENETWNMCPFQLEIAIKQCIQKGNKPKAIIFVHLYGMPAKVDEIVAISKKYNITLIEDAAEALGSEYKGEKCGTFGDFGIISFNNNKIITSFGGGALICKDLNTKKKAIYLATQAKDEAINYEHSSVGYNYRLSSVLSLIGIEQMKSLKDCIRRRRSINKFYEFLFEKNKDINLFKEHSNIQFSNHWLSVIIVKELFQGMTKENIRLSLLKDNIESRPIWKPMHLQPIFKKYKCYGGKVSEELFNKGLCLPSGSSLTKLDIKRISESMNKIL